MISIVIPIEPVAQGRPKFARMGQAVRAYDPAKSRKYKALVAGYAREQYTAQPLGGALNLQVTFYRPIQTSGSKRLKHDKVVGAVLPTVKPDLDNYFKAVTDALKGIVWVDDNQIVSVDMRKLYGTKPRTEIEIKEIKP
ncbi:RusA family crossover junction endodeoxyribonuclease [Lacticaseibacillus sharpeae]|uniref:RusA family crossover junction endodeoxyribonuclease n=1 Tax=Lacticaseibacillus sharpeae TaxID=1626 RepID=UPI0006D1D6AC|nr:RusA family crossover junction endodeoxyribonuclease [Lacticaseibacillus sharpeae]